MPRCLLPLVALSAGLLVCQIGCAPYRMGHQALFTPEIRSVHVPVFRSVSFRPGLGERLTEAVIREIQISTNLHIADESTADTILTGQIGDDAKRVVSENRFDDVRTYERALSVNLQWNDRGGNPIGAPIAMRPLIEFGAGSSSTAIPEAGPSMATTEQALIDRLARDIVAQLHAPW
jgi:hypothetical protein